MFSIFLDTRQFFEHFLKKCFFAPRKADKHLEKFSKFAKNEVKAVKMAVSAALRGMSATPHNILGEYLFEIVINC